MSTTAPVKSAATAITSIMDTIGTVAHSITRTVTTATAGLDMLDTFVTDAKFRQEKRSIAANHTFLTELLEETAREESKRQLILLKELTADDNFKKLYTENHEKLMAILIPQAS